MRYLHITDIALPHIGGVEYVVYRYSTMQMRDGHHAYVLTTKLPNTKKYEKIENVPYYRFSKIGMATSILEKIKKINPDLIHTHSYLSSFTLSYFHKINKK